MASHRTSGRCREALAPDKTLRFPKGRLFRGNRTHEMPAQRSAKRLWQLGIALPKSHSPLQPLLAENPRKPTSKPGLAIPEPAGFLLLRFFLSSPAIALCPSEAFFMRRGVSDGGFSSFFMCFVWFSYRPRFYPLDACCSPTGSYYYYY